MTKEEKEIFKKNCSERLTYIMAKRNISITTLAVETGIDKSSLSCYKSGRYLPKSDKAALLANVLKVSPVWLMGFPEVPMVEEERNIDFYSIGTVAAGYGHEAIEDNEDDFFSVPADILKGHDKEDFTMLTVSGDSMFPTYQDGDHLLILRQPNCENGSVAVVLYGEETNGTLKKVYFEGSSVILKPINPDYNEVILKGSQLDFFKIIGIPKYLTRKI